MPDPNLSASAACKRHRYRVTASKAIEKRGPTGHPSGWFGIWESRACVKCEVIGDGRYAPGINERTPDAARRAYRAQGSPEVE